MIRKLFFMASAILLGLPVYADTQKSAYYSFDAKGFRTYWNPDGSKTAATVDSRRSACKSPSRIATWGDPKPLDIELVYDEDIYQLDVIVGGQMDNGNFQISPDPTEKRLGMQDIPSGISGLMCVFQKYDKETGETDFYIIAKDIKNLPDGSRVVFDIADCVHEVRYNPLDSDGNPLSLTVTKDDEVVEQGKYLWGFSNITWSNVYDGAMWCAQAFYGKKSDSNGHVKYSRPHAIWYNDCGPDFTMGHYIICTPFEGRDYTVIEMPVYRGTAASNADETVLSNEPSQFRTYTQNWTRTPYSAAQYDQLCFGTRLAVVLNNNMSPWGIGAETMAPCIGTDTETTLHVCANKPSDANADLMSMLLLETMPESDNDSNMGLGSMWWKPTPVGREYKPINHIGQQTMTMPYDSYFYFVEDNYNEWLNTLAAPNPNLAFEDEKITGRLGNNCPVICVMPGDPTQYGSDLVMIYLGLVGRFGECNLANITNFLEEEISREYDGNNIRNERFSCDNFMIDGEVEAGVTAELGYKKGDAEADYFPPSITHLLTRDNENVLTDRFDSADEGYVEFYAADFYWNTDWSLGQYNFLESRCRPVAPEKMKVEYAPYGGSVFNELPCTEVQEKYFYPRYGNYYTVPLDGVTASSSNGWFDLRISLEDETGNTHVQTISPAFKINNLIGSVNYIEGADYSEPLYFDLTGRQVLNPTDGVYIRRQGNNVSKVMK